MTGTWPPHPAGKGVFGTIYTELFDDPVSLYRARRGSARVFQINSSPSVFMDMARCARSDARRTPGRAHRRDEMEEEALPSFFVQLPSERTKELLLPTT